MVEKTPDEMLIENFIGLMWKEFNDLSGKYKVASLIMAFSIIDACARLCAPDEFLEKNKTKERFCWFLNEFLNQFPYESIDLYGARCGLLHEYGAMSDLSRDGKCKVIAWTLGDRQHHGKNSGSMILLSKEQFCEDLSVVSIKIIERLQIDFNMQKRFAERLPNIFGANFY